MYIYIYIYIKEKTLLDASRSATEMSSLLTYAVLTHHALFLVLESGTVWKKRTP